MRDASAERLRIFGLPVGLVLALLFVLALALRLGAVMALGAPPEKDALQYHSIAVNLMSGHGYAMVPDVATTYRPPAYPVFLALIYRLFGADYHYALYAQAALNALLVLPLFWLTRRLSASVGCGLLAAGLFAVHTSFEIVTRIYAENLLIPLGLGFVCALYMASREDQGRAWGWYAVGGVLAGLMGLTKPEYGLLGLGALMLAFLWPAARRRWKSWVMVFLISMLIFSAWQVRNLLVGSGGERHLGDNTMIFANCPVLNGDGWWSVSDMPKLERQRAACHDYLAAHGSTLKGVGLTQLWLTHPAQMAKLVVNRILILWFSPPVGNSHLASVSVPLERLVYAGGIAFVILAFATLLRLLPGRPELFPLFVMAVYITAVYGLLHAIRRYGYPFVPELCLFAAWGVWRLFAGRRLPAGEEISR